MRLTEQKLDEFITAFIAASEAERDSPEEEKNWWAMEESFFLYKDPDLCWEFIKGAARRDLSPKAAGSLAAGPLHNFVESHLVKYIHQIEDLEKTEPRFKLLLEMLWEPKIDKSELPITGFKRYETLNELAILYLGNLGETTAENLWAHGEVLTFIADDPDKAWEFVLEAVRAAETKSALAYIAAGPVEDLLKHYKLRFLEPAIVRAKSDPKLLYTLCNVWLNEEDEAFLPWKNFIENQGIATNEDLETLMDLP